MVVSPRIPGLAARSRPQVSLASVVALALIVATLGLPQREAVAVGDPVIAAAGDIACDPASGAFNGGLGTANRCRQLYTSDLLVANAYEHVLALGDEQYECGGAAAFAASYDPSWGRVKSVTHPVVGNHEYQTSGGTDCGTGAAGYFNYFGAAAGPVGKGWYSFDIGAWHLIALNSNCTKVSCIAGGEQEQWLAADLAANPNDCTLAYFHHAVFSAGGTGPQTNEKLLPFWNDLYAAGADLVLTGHDHNYQRLPQLDASGNPDPTNGVREIIVGTGGIALGSPNFPYPGTEFFNTTNFGVLELTLGSGSYSWRFLGEDGVAIDAGSDTCVTAPPPTPTVTGFDPTSGPEGTAVTVSGTGFTGASSVTFNGTSAAFTVTNDTTIATSVPTGASTGPIAVTTPGGTGTSATNFTVTAPPPTGPAMVQQVLNKGGGGSPPSAAWSQPTGAGNLLVAAVGWTGSGSPTAPAGWTLARKAGGTAIFYRQGAPATSGTLAFGGSNIGNWVLDLMEWSGAATTGALDRTASASSGSSANTTARSGTTAVTSQPSEIAISAIRAFKALSQTNPTNGFVQVASGTQGTNTTGFYAKVLTATGAQSVSVTLSIAAKWRGVIATFRGA
ncbi:MAG TPA: IPT/TIG domain-containing protein [Actinomycetota bacterium]